MTHRLSEEAYLKLIQSTGALREGHFVLTSGLHSGYYVNKDDVSTKPDVLDELANGISDYFAVTELEVVAAPAVGAIALGNRVAEHSGEEILSLYAEAEGDKFVFRRGYDRFIPGKRILVVEDVITTGKTTKAMIAAVEALGGEVAGIGLLWNRSSEEFAVPVFACVSRIFPTYDLSDCLPCQDRRPINTELGHGQKFLDEYGLNPENWPANRK